MIQFWTGPSWDLEKVHCPPQSYSSALELVFFTFSDYNKDLGFKPFFKDSGATESENDENGGLGTDLLLKILFCNYFILVYVSKSVKNRK